MHQNQTTMATTRNRKKNLIVSYKNLPDDIKEKFKEAYPDGYSNYITKCVKPNGEAIFVVPFETEVAQKRFYQHKKRYIIDLCNEYMKKNSIIQRKNKKLIFLLTKFLNIDSMFLLKSLQN